MGDTNTEFNSNSDKSQRSRKLPLDNKITFFISSLNGGGSARVLIQLAERYSSSHEVTIYTLEEPIGIYAVSDKITVKVLKITSSLGSAFFYLKLVRCLRHILKTTKPLVFISFIHISNVLACLAAIGTGSKIVVAERSDLRKARIHPFWKLIRPYAYKIAKRIVLQNESDLAYFSQAIKAKLTVCPNPVFKQDIFPLEGRSSFEIITVGRLHPVKRYDLLIELAAPLLEKYPKWSLSIYGQGPELLNLQNLVTKLGIFEKVNFPGQVRDVWQVLANSSIFVMTSESEGMPNSLLEACIIGLPSVCFDSSPGIKELSQRFPGTHAIPQEDKKKFTQILEVLMIESSYVYDAKKAAYHYEKWNDFAYSKWDDAILGNI